jgi:hypothetical protein
MRGVADDGALIYFEDQRTPPTPDMLGHVVVVETDTDEVLVKRLLRGSRPGLYDLESVAGPHAPGRPAALGRPHHRHHPALPGPPDHPRRSVDMCNIYSTASASEL